MLDFFTIFSKGGIVLWCFQGTVGSFTSPVNELIHNVILQERSSLSTFTHGQLSLKYKLDNEFELVFVVAYQKILQLAYIDKLLDQIQLEFRDKYKDELEEGAYGRFSFDDEFNCILKELENESKNERRVMSTFKDSKKNEKIMAKKGLLAPKEDKNKKIKDNGREKNLSTSISKGGQSEIIMDSNTAANCNTAANGNTAVNDETIVNGTSTEDDQIAHNRMMLRKGMLKVSKKKLAGKTEKANGVSKVQASPSAKKKVARQWDYSGTAKDLGSLDYSKENGSDNVINGATNENRPVVDLKSMEGELKPIEIKEDSEEEVTDDNGDTDDSSGDGVYVHSTDQKADDVSKNKFVPNKGVRGGLFSFFKGLTGQKAISREAMEPVLDKMREHLCAKNVAADISDKLCQSVANKLEGKVLGTFSGITSAVRVSMEESLINILSPKRHIDILRDVLDAKSKVKPYTIVFCGVNGVGKSTNLAKICFWLLENNHRVLIAACDTFRSGAVEQLRTHSRHLNALHPANSEKSPPNVLLYDKGYGKDAAAVAMEAINLAREQRFDVVLVDTAGRMQDNEPLMRSLAKLIKINNPDLVLFVGEALVGNDGVDQLKKFNQALADHSDAVNPRLIDGIVLTKFDTIDDKVGAAISMTYTTGQPIVFVGTGQTYNDLRNLNATAVVKALLKA